MERFECLQHDAKGEFGLQFPFNLLVSLCAAKQGLRTENSAEAPRRPG